MEFYGVKHLYPVDGHGYGIGTMDQVTDQAAERIAPGRSGSGDLGSETYERIKLAIRDGSLTPGARLTEAELVQRLGVSRTPVRQALTRLEAEGLLAHEPRRGLVVARPDHQQVIELYAMREVLESTAARFAAQHASAAELRSLARLIGEEEKVLDDSRAQSAINQQVHTLVHRAAHNRYLLRSLAQLNDTMALLPTMLGDPVRALEAHAEHRAILEALERRDGDAAEAAMRSHIGSAQNHRVAWLLCHTAEDNAEG